MTSISNPPAKASSADNPDAEPNYIPLFLLLGAVLLSWVLFGAVIWSKDSTKTGPFGDTFGVLNTLFSGMAFAAFIYTVSLQRKELKLQRDELRDTRKELQGQREQMEQQNATAAQQRFESTFFRMVDLHHNIVGAIRMQDPRSNTDIDTGRTALANFGEYLRQVTNKNEFGPTRETRLKGVIDFYLANYHVRQHALAHYFRNLYRIMKLVHESNIPNKDMYAGIIRAQLSNSELILVFFNCLSPQGCHKFKPLTERYALFEHIPVDEPFLNRYRIEYAASAFGDNQPGYTMP